MLNANQLKKLTTEFNDYKQHCEENGLNPEQILVNSQEFVPHIYAVAKFYLWEVEQLEQKKFEEGKF